MLTMIIKNEARIMRRCLEAVAALEWGNAIALRSPSSGNPADAVAPPRRPSSGASRLVGAVCICDTGSTDDTAAVVTQACEDLGLPLRLVADPWRNFGHNRSRSFLRAAEFASQLDWPLGASYALLIDADMVLRLGPRGAVWEAFGEWQDGEEGRRRPPDCPSSESEGQSPLPAGATFMQRAGQLEYYNVRLARLDKPWRCIGSTHEYWSCEGEEAGPKAIAPEFIFIQDVGDGGAKADKYERDVRLLSEDIAADPTNVRAHFYLAQSLHHMGRLEEAAATYEKRIALGGWWEERWYAKLALGRVLLAMGRVYEAEAWLQRAAAQNPARAEPLVELATAFRNRGDNLKAAHYARAAASRSLPPSGLFVEVPAHTHRPLYERTITDYYLLRAASPRDALAANLRYLCNAPSADHHESVFSNLRFYVEPLAETSPRARVLHANPQTGRPWFPPRGEFVPSSVSILPEAAGTSALPSLVPRLANVRYVNYRMAARAAQQGRDVYTAADGVSTGRPVETRNALVLLDPATLAPLGEDHPPGPFWEVDAPPLRDSLIRGLEDVRLHRAAGAEPGTVGFTATQRQWTPERDSYRVVCGQLHVRENRAGRLTVLESPEVRDCEKNWIVVQGTSPRFCAGPLGEDSLRAIYEWGPALRVASAEIPWLAPASPASPAAVPVAWKDAEPAGRRRPPDCPSSESEGQFLDAAAQPQTPWLWRKFRGSSNEAAFGGLLYFVVHMKYYDQPSKGAMTYVHALAAVDPVSLAPRRTSQPFTFAASNDVEYCLSLDITLGGVARMWFSSRDASPALASVPIEDLVWAEVGEPAAA